ncbi:uncharacterized protein FA14DRAFT_159691 [Meira miltonrushii]|uniref:Uncharacterized protein n=1 Tax=Meira miltonrushii TaxID=1280837 RepID=A0A316VJP6_9BASI|nr:uncharacterized protein FA14DRAFT_159691 [Meira miltonrushii]PWN37829.1 hypothetical protein FA14DRAFT_159691 [Meira miltonrushii]
MPSLADLEQWIEEQIPQDLHDLPGKVQSHIQAYSTHLYHQIVDLTPSLAEIESSLPSNPFSAPAQAPPPPPSLIDKQVTFIDSIARNIDAYTGNRRRTSVITGIAFAGITYSVYKRSQSIIERRRIAFENDPNIPPRTRNGNRCDAVVILGVESQFGQSLAHTFASRGFIVLASVPSEHEKQSFDSLVPPSMRGYIKTIVLPDIETQSGHITNFARTVSTAQQLRWPLTAAGDPYAKPGTEINITAVINASSYNSLTTSESQSQFEVHTFSNEVQKRVVTPLAVMKALLSTINQRSSSATKVTLLSLIRSRGESDIITQSVKAGMRALEADHEKVPASYLVLEAREPSIRNLFLSLWPTFLGGNAIAIREEDSRTKQHSSRIARRSRKNSSDSTGLWMMGDAAISLLRQTYSNKSSSGYSAYFVRLGAVTDAQPSRNITSDWGSALESTTILRILQNVWTPITSFISALSRISRRGVCYSGTSNPSNSRPAFGPGPGPASNTHSRSCIRPSNENSNSSKAKRTRPVSTMSNGSSDHARTSESETGSGSSGTGVQRDSPATGSAPVSAPPSTHDMSSSGLLSSVPSSAFGDNSEEERYADSDYQEGTESPIVGANHAGFDASHLRAPSSDSWQNASQSSVLEQSASSDADDSGTALGTRNTSTDESQTLDQHVSSSSARTPSASEHIDMRIPSASEYQGSNQSPMQHGESGNYVPGTNSPLGQSWVALGQSSTEDQGH